MGAGFDRRQGDGTFAPNHPGSVSGTGPGKRTLVEELLPVQRSASSASAHRADGPAIQQAAAQGVAGGGSPLPHGETIQRLFGRHDVSGIEAHVDGPAVAATRAIGAEAYATGHHVAFASSPGLRLDQEVAGRGIRRDDSAAWQTAWDERWDAFWTDPENLPVAIYTVDVTDPRWIAHLAIGSTWESAAY